jgi:hypothetical protein
MEYLIGNLIGIANTTIGYPLDTIKVHYQKNNSMPKINLKLYRGVKYPLYNSIILNTIVFGNLDKLKNYTENSFMTGFILGGIGSLLINNFELKKIKSQLNYKNIKLHSLSGIKYTFLREGLGFGIFFSVYDILKKKEKPTFIAGSISGMTSWVITYPIDTIRTKSILNQPIKIHGLYNGLRFCLLRSFILDGIAFSIFEQSTKNILKK